jgi:hypothetical protein
LTSWASHSWVIALQAATGRWRLGNTETVEELSRDRRSRASARRPHSSHRSDYRRPGTGGWRAPPRDKGHSAEGAQTGVAACGLPDAERRLWRLRESGGRERSGCSAHANG